ncbi:MAG: choice-of-anchor D domain-containing protein [Sedimentisphaerales bacterium]|nr:choice-of-anchor D domain-containing protein [Sedimentisphaerales bacterium]
MKMSMPIVRKDSFFKKSFLSGILFFLGVSTFLPSVYGRQLFYVLDSISNSGPEYYINIVKCYDLNGVFQYELFRVDPKQWYRYSSMATDGSTAWLGGRDLGIQSFSIRPGGSGGLSIPYSSGSYSGMAIGNNGLWVSQALAWGTPFARIDVYNASNGAFVSSIPTLSQGWYPNSLQMVGATLVIKEGVQADQIYFINTGSDWEPYGPLTVTDAPLSPRALCADSNTIWLLGYSASRWMAYAYDWAGARQPARDAVFSRLSQPLDMYMAWGPDEPVLSVPSTTLDFDTLTTGQSASLDLEVENVGNLVLTVDSIELSDTSNYTISPDSLSSIPPGGSTTLSVTFQPQSVGDWQAELIIRTNDAYNPELSISLTGQAVSNIWYVDPEVEGGDGTSWENAFSDIIQALADASVLDGAEIRVRGGEYHDTVEINKSVTLIGAWDDEGNRSFDDYIPLFNGHDDHLPLKITADHVSMDGFDIEGGNNNAVYPYSGGGLRIEADHVTITNFWIGFCTAQNGGGISVQGNSNTIQDCWIEENQVNWSGGGIQVNGADNRIIRCSIMGNISLQGDGVGISNGSGFLTVKDCYIHGNQGQSLGGGIGSNSPISLINCLVCDNETAVSGPSDPRGAGVYCYGNLTMINCTVANNRIRREYPYGAGIYCHGTATVNNSILWGNRDTSGEIGLNQLYSYNPPIVTYSDIEDTQITGTGVIHQDPLFMNSEAEDWRDRNYWLDEDSPCIDSGTAVGAPDHDLDGIARPYGDGFDMGALEWIWRYPGPWYVDANVNESGGGQSWAQAFQTLGEALEEANDHHEIWVRAGTYHLGENTLWVGCDVQLLGGFSGTDETDKSQRDPVENLTIIDGDHDGGCFDIMADAVIDGFTITNSDAGGGGGIDFFNGCSPVVSNCIFLRNRADNGAGMLVEDGSIPLIINCSFLENTANEVGGGIDTNDGGSPIIQNCLFAGNTAGFAASALSAYHGFTQAYNCTFTDNVIIGGDYGGGAVAVQEAELLLDSCILWGNTGPENPQINIGDADVTIRYCSIDQDGFEGESGNIRNDPLFAASGIWDDNGTSEVPEDDTFTPGDYHLCSTAGRWDTNAVLWMADIQTSLCIDTGNPGLGVSLESEPHGNRRNLGVYGGTGQASRSPIGWSLASDLNNDGIADVVDLITELNDWLMEECSACPGDLNADGQVDLADFAIFAENWLGQTIWF